MEVGEISRRFEYSDGSLKRKSKNKKMKSGS